MEANAETTCCMTLFASVPSAPGRSAIGPRRALSLAIWAGTLLASGCYAGVNSASATGDAFEESGRGQGEETSAGDPEDGRSEDGRSDTGTMEAETSDGDTADEGAVEDEFVPPPAALRRLTVSEYRNSIRDLLGVEAPPASELPPDDSVGGFVSIAARRLAMSPQAIETFEERSYAIAEEVFADAARRDALLGCAPARADDACVQGFLTTFARRFYRRPAEPQEIMRLTAVVEKVATASDIWTGLSYGLAALLQSPNFLYRVELGAPEGDPPRRRYTAYELASRTAFLLTGSTPDDELLDAAETGALDTPDGRSAQIDRLMESVGVRDVIMGFFAEQLRLQAIAKANKAPELYPEFGPELVDAMQGELERLVSDWVWSQRRPLSELLVSPKTFLNSTLAEFYGVSVPPGEDYVEWYRDDADPRIGLIGAAGLLAGHSAYAETSPTRRGRYVAEQLLCLIIPEPPPGVDTNLPEVPEGTVSTMRERVEIHMTEPNCRTCHVAMDPVGLPLEHFDAIGRYRETDHGLSIDASGEIAGVQFDGLRGLASTLSQDPRVDACMVRRFYEFALGHSAGRSDEPAIEDLEIAHAAAAGDFTAVLRRLLEHDAFLAAAEVNP